MIKRASDMEKEYKEQMRGGKGTVEITHLVKQSELGGKCRLMAKLTLNEGCSIGRHAHEGEEEIFYIIKGTAQFDDNGDVKVITAGDAALTGGGRCHSVENVGEGTLEMVAVILLY